MLQPSPCLWNQLPLSHHQPDSGISSSISDSPIPLPITSSSFDLPLCSSVTPYLFHSRFKTYQFHKSFPIVSILPTGLPSRTIAWTVSSEDCFHFSFFFISVPCATLSWPSRQLLSARKYCVSYRIQVQQAVRFVFLCLRVCSSILGRLFKFVGIRSTRSTVMGFPQIFSTNRECYRRRWMRWRSSVASKRLCYRVRHEGVWMWNWFSYLRNFGYGKV